MKKASRVFGEVVFVVVLVDEESVGTERPARLFIKSNKAGLVGAGGGAGGGVVRDGGVERKEEGETEEETERGEEWEEKCEEKSRGFVAPEREEGAVRPKDCLRARF